ncbi:uncharacterized protein LOC123292250 [Chrysoperla carnea]|uniref:uncharacterized protein LOC123292250 n=1 Tax=Chrysoperla carnea TaxID=189513 RepID=UPI001D08631B|nr:uncharacterized protein LOC123292250 [Chrysoperla carnea]
MKILLFTILLLISTNIINCDEKIDRKEINKNEKRGAVGGIVYATKQPQYTESNQADASPNKIYAKPSPNVAFSTNTVYTQPAQAAYTKVAQTASPAPLYTTQTVQQAPQPIYAQQAQVQYAQQVPQHAQLIQVQPAYALSHEQQPQQIAYKVGYTQPLHHQQAGGQAIQYVQQAAPQPILYHAVQAPIPVAVAQPIKIGYTQPIYQKQQVQPAYATYASVPTNQNAEYAPAPVSLTKVGYTTPAQIATYAAPQQAHAPVAVHYSPASSVSQFSYSSPHVQYGSNGIYTQTSYSSAKSTTAPQQLNYSASQPIYTAIPAPQHLTYSAPAPLTLTKVGYTSPIINYH